MNIEEMLKYHPWMNKLTFPSYIVVQGDSKTTITKYNRSEYPEHFGEDVCHKIEDVLRLVDGYGGRQDDLTFRIIPNPPCVLHPSGNNDLYRDYTAPCKQCGDTGLIGESPCDCPEGDYYRS